MTVLKQYEPSVFTVERERVREYARAIGEPDPVHLDLGAAQAAGFDDLLAPQMFCVVYAADGVNRALADEDVGFDQARVLHGSQRFEWGEPVVAGDRIETQCAVLEPRQERRLRLTEITTESRNQTGTVVSRGLWTLIEPSGER